jgi:opacity protein-like surface antigen
MRTTSRALLPLCALLAAAPAGAQTYVGVFGGPSFSRLSFGDLAEEVDVSTRTGYGFGAVLGRELRDNLSLELQPLYVTKGAKLSPDGGGEGGTARLSYFEVPLVLKLSARSGGVRPYLLGGPVIGFRTSAKVESGGLSEDFEDQIKDTDFGLALGAGVQIPAGRGAVFVEGHYGLGLRDIEVVEPGDEPVDVKNRGFQVKVGFVFPARR